MKTLYLGILCLLISGALKAQTRTDSTATKDKAPSKDELNAISNTPAKTGLTYNTLSQFIQASVKTGKNGGFSFKSSFFGLAYLFGGKKDSLSSYYLSSTGWAERNQEIAFGVNKASTKNDQLSVITVGYKISPINQRDKSVVNFYKADKELSNGIDLADHSLAVANVIFTSDVAYRVLKSKFSGDDLKKVLDAADATKKEKIKNNQSAKWTDDDFENTVINSKAVITQQELKSLVVKFDNELKKVAGLDNDYVTDAKNASADYKRFKTIADSIFKKYGYTYSELNKNLQKEYNAFAKKIEMGSLLTFSINPGYNVQYHHFDTTSFNVRYLKGFGNYKKPWNIDLQSALVSLRDSASAPKDFGHNKLDFSAGVNKVFAVDDKDNPLLESEFAGEYQVVINGKYKHEQQQLVTLNLVTSIHLSKSFTLPLTMKYDIKHPNLFGFISILWNLEDSGKGASKN